MKHFLRCYSTWQFTPLSLNLSMAGATSCLLVRMRDVTDTTSGGAARPIWRRKVRTRCSGRVVRRQTTERRGHRQPTALCQVWKVFVFARRRSIDNDGTTTMTLLVNIENKRRRRCVFVVAKLLGHARVSPKMRLRPKTHARCTFRAGIKG